MLRTSATVFLGIVVNPKTKTPVYVTKRGESERTVDIWTLAESSIGRRDRFYISVGSGYLETTDGDADYLAPTEISGFPRSHTPEGLKGVEKGGGFGTCLYTGLVLLATVADRDELYVRNMAGGGEGICSDEDTRSPSATRWWRKALELGLTYQERGETEASETEELDDEDLESYMNRSGYRRVEQLVSDEIGNYGDWTLASLSLRGSLTRETRARPGQITVDIFTMDAADKHHLVAVRDVADAMTPLSWMKSGHEPIDIHKDVILALNVAQEDTQMAGKLARLAQEAGAKEKEVAAFMMRNRFGVDSWRYAPYQAEELRPADPELERMLGVHPLRHPRRLPPPDEATEAHELRDRALDMMARAGTARPNPLPVARRNPAETPTLGERREIETAVTELDKRRADLGWNMLEGLS